jgi:gluconokinase
VSASGPFVLSVDVGSSSIRTGLYDERGGRAAATASRRPHRFAFADGGRVEADPDALFDLVAQCIDESLLHGAAGGQKVAAVAFATFLHGMIGTDSEGRALTPVITWADSRSAEQSELLRTKLDAEEVRQRTGCPLHPVYFPSKLAWFRQMAPRVFDDVRWWCSIGEYCLRRIVGRTECSLSMASGSGLLNRWTGAWDAELLSAVGLDEARLSPLKELGSPSFGILPAYAQRWPALRDSAWFPVLSDAACSNVGSGCESPDRIALMIGTTGAMRAVRPAGRSPVPPGLWAYRMDRTRELVGGVLGDGGNLFEWMSGRLARGLQPQKIDQELLAAAPAGHGLTVLPFLTGERSTGWDARVRGAVCGLGWDTRGLDIVQAGVEAVAYRFAAILRALRPAVPGARDLIGTGGALYSSSAWGQILADVLELPLGRVSEPEASSRGAALLVLEALGVPVDLVSLRPVVERTWLPRASAAAAHRAAALRQERLKAALL